MKAKKFICRGHNSQFLFLNYIFFTHNISTLSDFNISSTVVTLPKFKIHIENQDEIMPEALLKYRLKLPSQLLDFYKKPDLTNTQPFLRFT